MAVRRESVRVSAEDAGFTTTMAKMTTAAAVFGSTLDHVDGSGMRVKQTLPQVSDGVEGVGRSARKSGPEIDRLSGRVRILADVMAILGPSAVPIAGIAVPAVTGLASQLGFAAIAGVSFVGAMQGVGDALKAVETARLEPTAANLEKAEAAMSNIGPDARKFVTEFQKLRPVLREMRDSAAAGWFPGLTEALDDLERLAPKLGDISQAIGERGGSLIAEGADQLAGPEWEEFWDFVEHNAPDAIDDLFRTLGNLTKGLAELWMAFDPTNDKFGEWLLEQSRDFAKWSEELSGTNGYREFIDYIDTNGPRVADAAGALADAILQIIEAVAPLGGPSLKIIELFGDAVSAIADSDLGTPILAGVAALALYSRGLQAAAALQTKLYGGTASQRLAQQGVLGFTKTAARDAKAAIPSMSKFGTVAYRMGQSSKHASEQTLAARKEVRAFSAEAAKGAAPVAGLALAGTGLADNLGVANTVSLGLLGTLGGPWGVAVGAAAGGIMDLDNATVGFSDTVDKVQKQISEGQFSKAADELAQLKEQAKDSNEISSIGDALDDVGKGLERVFTGDFGFLFGKDEEKIRQLADSLRDAEDAASDQIAFDALAERYGTAGEKAAAAAHQTERLQQAITNLNAVVDKQAAWIAYQAAIDNVTESIKQNGEGLNPDLAGGRENLTNLHDLIAATEQYSEQLSGLQRVKFLKGALADFDAAVEKAGGATKATRDLRDVLRDLLKATKIDIDTGDVKKAREQVIGLEDLLGNLDGSNTKPNVDANINPFIGKISTVDGRLVSTTNKGARPHVTLTGIAEAKAQLDAITAARTAWVRIQTIFGGKGSADGSTVPKDGGPYADRYPYMLAPGEEVTSNRDGQADTFRSELKDINRGMSRREVAERMMARGLAGGGTAGRNPSWSSALAPLGQSGGGRNPTWLPDGMKAIEVIQYELPNSLKGLNRALKRSEKAVDDETEARDRVIDKMDSIRDAASDRVRSDLFPNNDVWSAGGSFDDVMAVLNGDNLNGAQLAKDIEALRSKGVNQGALEALLREAPDARALTDFANRSAADLAKYVSAFNLREQYATKAGDAAAATYAKELAASNRELRQANARLDAIEKAIKAEHKEDRQSRGRGNSKGHRGRNGKK
ncbi:hypothetical protein GUY44_07375 [Pimelobacter simplex]|uniref:Phage tail length tape-measure protein n=1 Tax=Nocardioides simplex TaxID=2045 RepID=A0A0A1DF63_NOCSI|nr:hypothetical protein [Pimelobacter simplex]AIY15849.1 Phage tail length tape-measure protein [Pimelobacter simplex]MCG8150294.1 hypothetical protein [Pimelobacter simplex]GEB16659.1 hypothetical protein NSI01_49740 [Pimelobacter simplex]SFM90425.1 hypothetical protein SAMN05421671_4124 [Pimelobacter simplex]